MLKHSLTGVVFTAVLAMAAFGQDGTSPSVEDGPGAIPAPAVAPLTAITNAQPNIDNSFAVESFVDGVVQTFMEDEHIAGATVSIVHNGRIVLEKGYGQAALDPPRPVRADTTLFRIGSISKTFTWTSILQLVERGALTLDDPVNAYLPEGLRFSEDGNSEPIRIRHLMTHSPGLEDTAIGHLFFDREQAMPGRLAYLTSYRPTRVRQPGRIASYSNYGVALAGVIIEQVSGLNFERYVEENILDPLSMAHTTFREPTGIGRSGAMEESLAANLSTGFTFEQGYFKPRAFEFIGHIAPAGSASSTASDMARYMIAHLNEGALENARILGADTVRDMRRTLLANAPGVMGLSHGFLQYRPGGYFAYGHGGATLYFMSNMVMVPELELGIFVSTNTATGRKLGLTLPDLFVERFFEPKSEATPQPPEDFLSRADRFTGTYLTTRRSYSSLEKLFLSIPGGFVTVSAHPDGYLLTSSVSGTTRWVEIAPLTFQKVDGNEFLGFVEDDDGEIRYLSSGLGITAAEKVGFFSTPNWLGIITALVVITSVGMIVGGWLRRRRDIAQSRHERHSARLMPLLGLAWLAFIGLFGVAISAMAAAGNQIVFSYPSAMLIVSLVVALIAAAFTVIAVFTLYPVWTERSWSPWRRVRHTLAVAVCVAFLLTLNAWHVVGFQYY